MMGNDDEGPQEWTRCSDPEPDKYWSEMKQEGGKLQYRRHKIAAPPPGGVTQYLSPFVGQLKDSVVHLGCSTDSSISELQTTLVSLVGGSSELLNDMKPVVRESLNNLDDGMLKTLVAFCESSEEQTMENFVAWLNSRGQVEVMLMWIDSMSKVNRYQNDTNVVS